MLHLSWSCVRGFLVHAREKLHCSDVCAASPHAQTSSLLNGQRGCLSDLGG
jgi:hypothetical protein